MRKGKEQKRLPFGGNAKGSGFPWRRWSQERFVGWVAEWLKAPVLKTGVGFAHRGFESLPIR
jgi:hypothetical protein